MQDGLTQVVARIDERTEHMEADIQKLDTKLDKVSDTVNKHCEDLAGIKSDITNFSRGGLNKKQAAGIGSAGGLIVGGIIALIDFFMTH